MTIARLKKVTLCGLLIEKTELLRGLQELGCMHLLPLRPAPAEVENVAPPRAEAAYKALRFLSDMKDRRKQVTRDPSFEVDKVIAQALDVKDRLRTTGDRRDFLEHRIATLEPWGDLDFPPHGELGGNRFWFYEVPLYKVVALEHVDLPWQVVFRDNRHAYVVVIARDEPPGDLLPVPRTHTGALPQRELKRQLEDTEVELENIVAERQALTRYIYLLSAHLAEAENAAALAHADQQTRDEERIVAVQGWVPEDAIAAVETYAEERGLACLIEEPTADDSPPTLLLERPEMEAGVDLAMFYQVPGYRSWDPSLALFFSFSVFFAMILSDAGYGLVLLGGLLAFWRKLGKSSKGRAYRLLGLSLFGASVIYGALVGSYFGVVPPEGSLLSYLHVLDTGNYRLMMQISIIIGILHLVLAQGIVAYLNWGRPVAFSKLGWISGLFGGFLVVFAESGGLLSILGWLLLLGGLLAVFLFSSERPLPSRPVDYLWRALDGVKSLTGVMGLFGDVLSYMRLFALGLASASLAVTFNGLAQQVEEAVPGIGLLFAILILIFGHTINLGLSIMSGVVHGLRLNFMEFYKWGMPDEGEAFRKFARKEAQL